MDVIARECEFSTIIRTTGTSPRDRLLILRGWVSSCTCYTLPALCLLRCFLTISSFLFPQQRPPTLCAKFCRRSLSSPCRTRSFSATLAALASALRAESDRKPRNRSPQTGLVLCLRATQARTLMRSMVFFVGPRQSGKTAISKQVRLAARHLLRRAIDLMERTESLAHHPLSFLCVCSPSRGRVSGLAACHFEQGRPLDEGAASRPATDTATSPTRIAITNASCRNCGKLLLSSLCSQVLLPSFRRSRVGLQWSIDLETEVLGEAMLEYCGLTADPGTCSWTDS